MLPDECINMPVTYSDLPESQQIEDILYFLEVYNIDTIIAYSYNDLANYMDEIKPIGTYFGEDEFGVVGFWELYETIDYYDELEDFYERF